MNGQVDDAGRALLPIAVRDAATGISAQWNAWIDTGFTGDLVVPRPLLIALGAQPTSTATGILADGSQVVLDRYSCLIDWFGQMRLIEVIANDGAVPLARRQPIERPPADDRLSRRGGRRFLSCQPEPRRGPSRVALPAAGHFPLPRLPWFVYTP